MFDSSIPEKERLKFVMAEPWRMQMARDWAPTEAIGKIHALLSKNPALAASFPDYDSFRVVAKLLIDNGLDEAPGAHPILRATFSFIVAVEGVLADKPDREWHSKCRCCSLQR